MDIYKGQGKEINEAWQKLIHKDKIAMQELYDIFVCLQSQHFPIMCRYRPIVFLFHKDENKFEIFYKSLRDITINFIKKYMLYITFSKVKDIKEWGNKQRFKINLR